MIINQKPKISWRRLIYLLCWGILTAVLVVACSPSNDVSSPPQPDDCRMVEQATGKVCIPRNPQRIITLHPNPLANSLALGVRPIASAFYRSVPVLDIIQQKAASFESNSLESVGDLSKPNLEKILLLEPDLIISYSGLESIYPQLAQIAPTVVLNLPFPPPAWQEQLKELAQIIR